MIEKCHFKHKVESHHEFDDSYYFECPLGRYSAGYQCSGIYNTKCPGEDNCFLFQTYKMLKEEK